MKNRVLIGKDDTLIRMDTLDPIEGAGFEAIEAANADEAIIQLETPERARFIAEPFRRGQFATALRAAA